MTELLLPSFKAFPKPRNFRFEQSIALGNQIIPDELSDPSFSTGLVIWEICSPHFIVSSQKLGALFHEEVTALCTLTSEFHYLVVYFLPNASNASYGYGFCQHSEIVSPFPVLMNAMWQSI